jgi:hypothetical protein
MPAIKQLVRERAHTPMNFKLCQKSLTKMRLRYGNRMDCLKQIRAGSAKLLGTAIVIVQGRQATWGTPLHSEVRLIGGDAEWEQPWRSQGLAAKMRDAVSAAATSARCSGS